MYVATFYGETPTRKIFNNGKDLEDFIRKNPNLAKCKRKDFDFSLDDSDSFKLIFLYKDDEVKDSNSNKIDLFSRNIAAIYKFPCGDDNEEK